MKGRERKKGPSGTANICRDGVGDSKFLQGDRENRRADERRRGSLTEE